MPIGFVPLVGIPKQFQSRGYPIFEPTVLEFTSEGYLIGFPRAKPRIQAHLDRPKTVARVHRPNLRLSQIHPFIRVNLIKSQKQRTRRMMRLMRVDSSHCILYADAVVPLSLLLLGVFSIELIWMGGLGSISLIDSMISSCLSSLASFMAGSRI